jgi:hypothetical protein
MILMEFKRISDSGFTISFDSHALSALKKYNVEKSWKHRKNGSSCWYNFKEDEGICEHLLLWDTLEVGNEYQPQIYNLERATRMSHLPFRVLDVLQEVLNNDELPKNCEVRIRAFYFGAHVVFIFGNNPKALADIVLARTKEYIRKYDKQYSLEEADRERFVELLAFLN